MISHSTNSTPLTPAPMLIQCFFMHRIHNTTIDPFPNFITFISQNQAQQNPQVAPLHSQPRKDYRSVLVAWRQLEYHQEVHPIMEKSHIFPTLLQTLNPQICIQIMQCHPIHAQSCL